MVRALLSVWLRPILAIPWARSVLGREHRRGPRTDPPPQGSGVLSRDGEQPHRPHARAQGSKVLGVSHLLGEHRPFSECARGAAWIAGLHWLFPLQAFVTKLAEADVHDKVQQLQEFFADYFAVSRDMFSLNLGGSLSMVKPTGGPYGAMSAPEATFQRCVDGIMSVILSHKAKPLIRFFGDSPLAASVARAVDTCISGQPEIFSIVPSRPTPGPLLLVLDRKDDPVTPLLSQWTYQAMIHEVLGLWSNRVDLSKSPGVTADLREVVLDPSFDAFYTEHMYSNFGEFAEALQRVIEDYQKSRKVSWSRAAGDECPRVRLAEPRVHHVNRGHATVHGQVPRAAQEARQRGQARRHHVRAESHGGGAQAL
jgi:hypothetical protein